MPDPYRDSVRRRLSEFAPQLCDRLGEVPELEPRAAEAVLDYLIDVACRSSHIGFIQVGRRALAGIPREWLIARIETARDRVLDPNDEWNFRRFVELCCFLDVALAERVVEDGLASEVEAIRQAAQDYQGRCAAFAKQHGGTVWTAPW